MKRIKIATDYSETPYGRYLTDSEVSGERFREDFLRQPLEAGEELEIDIDDAEGYGSSFLDEAFGGLVREGYLTAKQVEQRLRIKSIDPEFTIYRELIWKYIKDAKLRPKEKA